MSYAGQPYTWNCNCNVVRGCMSGSIGRGLPYTEYTEHDAVRTKWSGRGPVRHVLRRPTCQCLRCATCCGVSLELTTPVVSRPCKVAQAMLSPGSGCSPIMCKQRRELKRTREAHYVPRDDERRYNLSCYQTVISTYIHWACCCAN